MAKDNMSCLKSVPAMSQETLLLQELLYCLLGNGGQHIVPLRGSSGITSLLSCPHSCVKKRRRRKKEDGSLREK